MADTPRQRESLSLAPVMHGLENMGAEFLESMVCPLSRQRLLGLTTTEGWEGLGLPASFPLPCSPHPLPAQSTSLISLLHCILSTHCVLPCLSSPERSAKVPGGENI